MPADEFDKRDEDKDLELDLMAEQELLRLTRQYRVMEGDKEAYLEEATKFLRRQRQNIQDLETTKKELLRGLKSSCSNRNNRKDGENANRLDGLVKEQDSLTAALQQERMVAGDLETQVQRIERQIAMQRKAASIQSNTSSRPATAATSAAAKTAAAATRERHRDIGHKIILLENRLDGVMINFNAVLSQNAKIRKEIDHLVQERSNFNDMIAKLQKKIAGNKKTVSDITELAIQAFDQRDECQTKIQALQDRNEKDAQLYASELKELQRTLDHDEKLKDFLFAKSNDRVLAAQLEQEEKSRARAKAGAGDDEDLDDIERYKDAFTRIRTIVGPEASLDKIVADFIKVEDQNFALFNYVTEMNNQVEALQEGIGRLRTDIKEAKGRGDERERQQREQLANMEKKLESSKHEADSAETKLSLMESVIGKLKVGTEDLYAIANVGSTPVLSLLGPGGGGVANQEITGLVEKANLDKPVINENNVIMYLDMIHEKVLQLKGVAQFLDYKSGKLDIIAMATTSAAAAATAAAAAAKLAAAFKNNPNSGVTLAASSSAAVAASGAANAATATPAEKILKRMPSSAKLLGKDDDDLCDWDSETEARPFDLSALKTRAFVMTQRERREAIAFAADDRPVMAADNKKGKKKAKK